MSTGQICALCGSRERLIAGAVGVVCKGCLAKAITSTLEAGDSAHASLTASDRCLLCGETAVSRGDYAAVRSPYVICAGCMKDGLDTAGLGAEGFWVARF